MSGEARDEFAAFGIPDGDVGKFATGLSASLKKNFADTMKLLRNEPFQKLLVDYVGRKRSSYEPSNTTIRFLRPI
jgi:hypothetical protein